MIRDSGSERHRPWWGLGFVLAANVLVFAGVTVMNVALPAVQIELGLDAAARQWVVTLYALCFGTFMLLAGQVADLVGLRRCLIIGLLAFGATSLAGGLATSTALLLATRATQGMAGALVAATALGLLSTLFPSGPDRARAFAALGVVMGIGTAGSFLLGGAFVDALSWRWCLLFNLPCVLVIMVGILRTVPKPAHSRRVGRIDALGTGLVTGALACLVASFDRASVTGWSHPLPVALLGLGLVMVTVFVRRSRTMTHPLVPPRLVRDRRRGGALVAVAGVGLGMFAGMYLLGSFLQDAQGRSAVVVGLTLIPFGVSATLVSRWAGRWRGRTGSLPLLSLGLVLVALALATFLSLQPDSALVMTLPATLLLGAGGTLVMVVGAETATSGAGPDSGVAGSLVNSVQQLGAALGTGLFAAIMGTTSQPHDGYARAGAVGAALLVIVAAGLVGWRRRRVRRQDVRHTGRRRARAAHPSARRTADRR